MIIRAGGLGVVASLSSEVSVSNSTSDTTILAYTLSAGTASAGKRLRFEGYGIADNGSLQSASLIFWLKNQAGYKIFSIVVPAPVFAAQADKPWHLSLVVVIRTTGASGTMMIAATAESDIPSQGAVITAVLDEVLPIDTTANHQFTLGMNWNVADASNTAKAEFATWEM